MSSAQVNVEKLRICWGVRRGRRLVCGEPVTDETVIKEVKELISELKERVERHKSKLENAAFIDELIDLLERWLGEHKGDRGRKVREARKVVRKMIGLLKELRKKWVEIYWRQFMELMDLLEKSAIDIIVTGENNGNKSLMIHLYNKGVAIEVNKVAKGRGITINLTLSELEGDDVMVANTFSDEEALKAIQHGWEMTDGSVEHGHPSMVTSQPWQAVLWPLCYPGRIHMYISGININGDAASITWRLIANDHETKPKEEVAEEVRKLSTERLSMFLAPAVWGDGYINVGERYLKLVVGLAKYELWLGIIERLVNELGFTIKVRDYKVEVKVNWSKAVKLVRDWLAIPDIRELIELGASLGGEKLRRIIELANMEVKESGNKSIMIPGTNISMTIIVRGDCKVELRARRKDEIETLRLVEELKKAGYETSLRVARRYYEVAILHSKIRDKPELREPVCRKLGEWLNETSNERRKKKIAKAVQKLKCFDNA